MTFLDILTDGFFAALAGIGFGAISNPRKKTFPYIALLAAIGHALRFILIKQYHIDLPTASFFAGLLIGFTSLPLGKLCKCPSTVLYIPALLPMIPGKFAYNTIFAIILFIRHQHDINAQDLYMLKFFSNGIITITTIFFLSIGAIFPVFLFPRKAYSLTRIRKRKK